MQTVLSPLPASAERAEGVGPSSRYRLASRTTHPADSVVRIGPHAIGGGHFQVIAGPCAVESREQLFRTVEDLRAAGIGLIRAGAYKPRTSPYDFQGLGDEALRLLGAVKAEFEVKVVTEVIAAEHVGRTAEVADVLQIGSRNSQNYHLLQEAAKAGRAVLLKRGMAMSIDEWLSAAEYLLAGGCSDVILCERGIKTFGTATRNTLDLGGLAVTRQRTHLPVIVDPSHAAGRADLVAPLALAAVGAGADGLLIECHCAPAEALCDSAQQLQSGSVGGLFDAVRQMATLMGKTPGGRDHGHGGRAA